MKQLCGIAWSEGMYLAPHHFQAQARYFEDKVHFAVTSLWKGSYGFTDWILDAKSLQNGTVSITHARGVFADGAVFDISADDDLPSLSIRDIFPPNADTLTVFLGTPARVDDGLNCDLESPATDRQTRFKAVTRVVTDENTGRDPRQVTFGRCNIRLFAETEFLSDWICLPLARVVRDGSGHFVFDGSFIPPSLQITASRPLLLLVESLIQKLEQKSIDLSLTRKTARRSLAEFASHDVAGFWLLHTVNSATAAFRHLLTTKAHPQELFTEMLRLAGALCTFGRDANPNALPLYDHQNLGACFRELDRHIRQYVDFLLPENCLIVPLVSAADSFYEAEVTDGRAFGRSRWILSLHTPVATAHVLRTLQLIKVCSAKFVRELVKRSLPGLALVHLPVLPRELVPRMETEYFEIRRAGPCWEDLAKSHRLGVFLPGELAEPELQVLILLDPKEDVQ